MAQRRWFEARECVNGDLYVAEVVPEPGGGWREVQVLCIARNAKHVAEVARAMNESEERKSSEAPVS